MFRDLDVPVLGRDSEGPCRRHNHTCLSLPVCEENGSIINMVDVMDLLILILGCGGRKGLLELDLFDCER